MDYLFIIFILLIICYLWLPIKFIRDPFLTPHLLIHVKCMSPF